MILKYTATFQLLLIVSRYSAWNITTVEINSGVHLGLLKKLNPPSAFVHFRWSWSWSSSNLDRGYFTPRSTQPSIPPGSVNEYQLRLGRQRQVWLIPIADERVGLGMQVKLKSLENTCHTWALLRWWFTTKRHYIKCMYLLVLKKLGLVYITARRTVGIHRIPVTSDNHTTKQTPWS